MDKPNGLVRRSLQTQLEACKLIAEVNQELLERHGFTQKQLAHELGLAQSYLIKKLNEVRTMIGQPKFERGTLIVRKSNNLSISNWL